MRANNIGRLARQMVGCSFAAVLAACGGSQGSSGTDANVGSPAPAPAPASTSTATLSWGVPAQNVDGSSLTDISGYRVLYGTSASSLGASLSVSGANTTSATISGLTVGVTYYFAVVTVNTSGETSPVSGVASKLIQ